jgi:hypothetical protein
MRSMLKLYFPESVGKSIHPSRSLTDVITALFPPLHATPNILKHRHSTRTWHSETLEPGNAKSGERFENLGKITVQISLTSNPIGSSIIGQWSANAYYEAVAIGMEPVRRGA